MTRDWYTVRDEVQDPCVITRLVCHGESRRVSVSNGTTTGRGGPLEDEVTV